MSHSHPLSRPVLLASLWTLVILAACTVPGKNLPDVQFFSLDKWIHAGMFLVLAVLWLAVPTFSRRWPTVLLAGVAYGAFTEIYQGWLPWDRTPDSLDFLANCVGLATGVLLFLLLRGRVSRSA